MNNHAFNRWLQDFRTRFPSVDEWLGSMDPPGGNPIRQKALLATWLEALVDVDEHDAIDVNRKLASGDLEPIPNYDRDKIPAIIRRHAREQMRSRLPKAESERIEREAPIGSARGYMIEVEKLIKDGMSPADAAKQVMPAATESRESRRYECAMCLDSGYVLCWNCVAIQKAVNSEPLTMAAGCDTFSVPCSCQRGWKKSEEYHRDQFDPKKACRVVTGDPDELREWIMTKQNEKRISEFDLWNRRAETEAVR